MKSSWSLVSFKNGSTKFWLLSIKIHRSLYGWVYRVSIPTTLFECFLKLMTKSLTQTKNLYLNSLKTSHILIKQHYTKENTRSPSKLHTSQKSIKFNNPTSNLKFDLKGSKFGYRCRSGMKKWGWRDEVEEVKWESERSDGRPKFWDKIGRNCMSWVIK